MQTTGINLPDTIEKLQRIQDIDSQAYIELALKSMIVSCHTYGGINVNSYEYKRYILPYKAKLTDAVFDAVCKEQTEWLQANTTVKHNVSYSEGVGYNTLVIK